MENEKRIKKQMKRPGNLHVFILNLNSSSTLEISHSKSKVSKSKNNRYFIILGSTDILLAKHCLEVKVHTIENISLRIQQSWNRRLIVF